MPEHSDRLVAYSAAACAGAVSLSALCIAYNSFQPDFFSSFSPSGSPSKDKTRPLVINNYPGKGDRTSASSEPRSRSGSHSSSSSKPESSDEKDSKESKSPEKKYKRILQWWSENEYAWKDKEEKEPSQEELEAAEKLLFTVKVREARDDEEDPRVLVYVNSEPLRVALKEVLLEDQPQLYEQNPRLEGTMLFYKWDVIKELSRQKSSAIENYDKSDKTFFDTAVQATEFFSTAQRSPVEGKEGCATQPLVEEIAVTTPPQQQYENPKIMIVKRSPLPHPNNTGKSKGKKLPLDELKMQRDALQAFLTFLDAEYGKTRNKLALYRQKGIMDYRTLWAHFTPGSYVTVPHEDSGEKQAMVVEDGEYEDTIRGKYFVLTGKAVEWQGSKFVRSSIETRIKRFQGQRTASTLKVTTLSDTQRKELTERGRKYVSYCGSYYMAYEGDLIMVTFSRYTRDKIIQRDNATGRVMVDRESYRLLNPSGYGACPDTSDDCPCDDCVAQGGGIELDEGVEEPAPVSNGSDKSEGTGTPKSQAANGANPSHSNGDYSRIRISESDLCLLPPTLFGFSFALREWGQLLINFSDIKFDEHAFDQLVLDENQKTVVRSLVDSTKRENYEKSHLLSDLISGKGGGLIIVLYGTPGTGKTLTAEAVAERLQRPLYIISSGQLGSDPNTLETSLQKTLELAERWNCVTLIDEADVFLEARSTHEMVRNALVAVFLKMLERFHGTLFLTTNRAETFDPAFISRFSLAIKYNELDTPARTAIWRRFLEMAGVKVVTSKKSINGSVQLNGTAASAEKDQPPASSVTERQLETLASAEINGRQVKQIVRSSQALALASAEPLQMKHCKMILEFTKKFTAEFESAGEIDYSAKDSVNQSRSHLYR